MPRRNSRISLSDFQKGVVDEVVSLKKSCMDE